MTPDLLLSLHHTKKLYAAQLWHRKQRKYLCIAIYLPKIWKAGPTCVEELADFINSYYLTEFTCYTIRQEWHISPMSKKICKGRCFPWRFACIADDFLRGIGHKNNKYFFTANHIQVSSKHYEKILALVYRAGAAI